MWEGMNWSVYIHATPSLMAVPCVCAARHIVSYHVFSCNRAAEVVKLGHGPSVDGNFTIHPVITTNWIAHSWWPFPSSQNGRSAYEFWLLPRDSLPCNLHKAFSQQPYQLQSLTNIQHPSSYFATLQHHVGRYGRDRTDLAAF